MQPPKPQHGTAVFFSCGLLSDGVNGNKTNASVSDPMFVDAANDDYRLADGSPLVNAGGPFADWMGPRRADSSVRDLGEAEWTYEPVGDYGIRIDRGETAPRATGSASDMGTYELFYKPGMMRMFN